MRRGVLGVFLVLSAVACQELYGMRPFAARDSGGGGSAGAPAGSTGGGAGAPGSGGARTVTECEPETAWCQGARLVFCNEEGDGLVDPEGEICATPELCERGKFGGACAPPTCAAGEYECSNAGGGALRSRSCPSSRLEWQTLSVCERNAAQCSPDARGCFALGMDATEVTRGQYEAFLIETSELDDQERIELQVSACAWNGSFVPDAACMQRSSVCKGNCDDHPQVCVDWCDALAYCQAQGKTLCGSLGEHKNVGLDDERARDPRESSYANACSVSVSTECAPALLTSTIRVQQSCQVRGQGYDHLRGLTGNVSEWEYACEKSMEGASDERGYCFVRGGSFGDAAPECLSALPLRRNAALPDVGFRCCAITSPSVSPLGAAGASHQ